MTQPENFTAAQASDPQTPGQMLADIAAQRPDLRPAVAANPSAYPALLDWLKSLGEPAVDAALAARAQATQVLPVQPAAPATPPAPSWAGGAPTPAAAPAPAYTAAPAYGAPQGMPPQGMPPQGMPPQGMPPGGMTPGYAGTPPQKSNKALWIVLIIIGVVLLLGGLTVFLILRAAQNAADDIDDGISDILEDVTDDIDDTTGDTTGDDPMSFGDDPTLDALYTACGEGDWQACDDLYNSAPIDSEYFAFADTCGGVWDAGTTTYCVEAMAEGDDSAGPAGDGPAEQAYFLALTEACAAQEWAACDELYWQSPGGSTEETFGRTCGGATDDGYGDCSGNLGGTPYAEPMARGDSRFLDMLWDACEGGDTAACEAMYWNSPVDSEYEEFAETRY